MPRIEELEDRKIYPSGDLPPEEEVEEEGDPGYAAPEGDPAPAEEPLAGDPAAEDPAGEDPSWEERYRNLEKKLGEQGNELGAMRQQNQELQESLTKMQQAQSPEGQEQAQDLQTQLQGIRQKMDNGDLSPDEAMFETANIVAQMSKMEAEQVADQRLQKFQQDAEADKEVSRFHEKHPDFGEVRQSGVLDQYKAEFPGLYDDLAAYQEHRIAQAEQAAKEAHDKGYEKGKAEMEKLSQGDAAAGKVLSKPGGTIRQKTQQPLTKPGDVRQSMLQRLQSVRQQGG